MNLWQRSSMRWSLAVFGIAMAGLAAWAFWRFGATLLAAAAVVIAIGCFGAVLYAWRLARRSLQSLERMDTPPRQISKERP